MICSNVDPEVDEASMEKADEELREIIQKLWPFADTKTINLALPLKEGTVDLISFLMELISMNFIILLLN